MTLTKYMEAKFSGKYTPFTESATTYIGVPCVNCGGRPAHSTRVAKAIAQRMRADGWNVRLSNGILVVKQ